MSRDISTMLDKANKIFTGIICMTLSEEHDLKMKWLTVGSTSSASFYKYNEK